MGELKELGINKIIEAEKNIENVKANETTEEIFYTLNNELSQYNREYILKTSPKLKKFMELSEMKDTHIRNISLNQEEKKIIVSLYVFLDKSSLADYCDNEFYGIMSNNCDQISSYTDYMYRKHYTPAFHYGPSQTNLDVLHNNIVLDLVPTYIGTKKHILNKFEKGYK